MLLPPHFTTNRLTLRPPVGTDALPLFTSYTQDPHVTRYLVWEPHTTLADTESFLQRCLDNWRTRTEYTYVIALQSTAQLLGMVSIRLNKWSASLGYVLAQSAWGQGIMPEAIDAIVDWLLAQPSVFRVWAVCDVENRASARVMEKIGMVCEGVMRRGVVHPNISPEPRDCWLYAKVK